MGRSREWCRGPGKFLNFNQIGFERVWLLLKERERLMLKLRGRGEILKIQSCLQASLLRDTQAGMKAGMGEQRGSRGPISLRGTRMRCARQRSIRVIGNERKNLVGKGIAAGTTGQRLPSFGQPYRAFDFLSQ